MSWQLKDNQGLLVSEHWNAKVFFDADGPYISIRETATNSETQLKLSRGTIAPLADVYVRQSDVIAQYPQTDSCEFSFQIDVRKIEETPRRLCLEIWASVQTFLLDSYPAIVWSLETPQDSVPRFLTSQHVRDDYYRLIHAESLPENGSQVGALLDSYDSANNSNWCLMVHPRDEQETELQNINIATDARPQEFGLRLFGGFMEKGVIRRAKLRLVVDRDGLDRDELDRQYQFFCDSPLPLTT